MTKKFEMLDANEAVASVAYRLSEVIAIYPITPSSPMGEWADAWSNASQKNIWSTVPRVIEMQSEGGAIGAIHGALQTGSLATTFTASQGLLLMIPNMYKIAGELTPLVIHAAARTVATHALSIFGDHSDVMAARSTGFAMLCSNSVQEAADMALIAHAATLESRIPFKHFFDGFRTSHEIQKIEILEDAILTKMIDNSLIRSHRDRALSPDHPVLRGTAQNPDVYFQSREAANLFYSACPKITQKAMDQFARLTGRQYHLYEYHGAPDAERVIVLMGSGAEAVHETADHLIAQGEKVGVLKVRLYRPFDQESFARLIPSTAKTLAVLDRTKEPGSPGEPLYLDCVAAVHEMMNQKLTAFKNMPRIIGGRYGLSSKEFTPAMIKGIFDHMKESQLKNHFTIGIEDDVTGSSLKFDQSFSVEKPETFRAIFYGLGSDGTVGANKNSIKIIGDNTDFFAQGYFVYDSKKAGAVTISHLRFGRNPIRSSYLISRSKFVGCHHPLFLERYGVLNTLENNGVFLLNTPYGPKEIWAHLPVPVQKEMIQKKIRFYVIDANSVARDCGMGGRINTIMQVCFFAISGVLPEAEAIQEIKDSIIKTYGKKGEEVVQMNLKAVDITLSHLFSVELEKQTLSAVPIQSPISKETPAFVQNVIGRMISNDGDALAVSAMPPDGTYPTGTSKWEKRNLAQEIPVWDTDVCIQCAKCVMVCPHGVIRVKAYDPKHLENAPSSFKSSPARDAEFKHLKYTIQVAPEDCTGCGICVDICPAKNKSETKYKAINMRPQPPLVEQERANWDFFLKLPELDRRLLSTGNIRQQQIQEPLFEFSSACAGCGETPYLKLASQLFGDRMIIANATGCSSIYGGNLPTTPWTKNQDGRGPAWANSLFEDNAEFGLGMRISLDKQIEFARELLKTLSGDLGENLVAEILNADQKTEADIFEQREKIEILKNKLRTLSRSEAQTLLPLADILVKKSVWIIGGDGWAYDIGFGGLDHVLSSGRNVNVLVLDTEVYSNTGGQMSKSTPKGAVAKFAAGGKSSRKKDLGLIAMSYGHIYVASVAMGAKDEHTLRAFLEAEAYDGPSLIIAYSHCIAHGINMTHAMSNQKAAVASGQWLLYRYHPEKAEKGENPLTLDSLKPRIPLKDYFNMENRFKMLSKTNPETADALFRSAQDDVLERWKFYEFMSRRMQKTPPEANAGPGIVS